MVAGSWLDCRRPEAERITSGPCPNKGMSNSVGLATESTETFELFRRELSALCGKGSFSPFS
jgi:hypothetical protein